MCSTLIVLITRSEKLEKKGKMYVGLILDFCVSWLEMVTFGFIKQFYCYYDIPVITRFSSDFGSKP